MLRLAHRKNRIRSLSSPLSCTREQTRQELQNVDQLGQVFATTSSSFSRNCSQVIFWAFQDELRVHLKVRAFPWQPPQLVLNFGFFNLIDYFFRFTFAEVAVMIMSTLCFDEFRFWFSRLHDILFCNTLRNAS